MVNSRWFHIRFDGGGSYISSMENSRKFASQVDQDDLNTWTEMFLHEKELDAN